MFSIVKVHSNFDFVGKRFLWIGISIVAILATIVLSFTHGLNYGIDFTGGAEVKARMPATWDTGKIRETLEKSGINGLQIIQIGGAGSHEYLIRAQQDGDKKLDETVALIQSSFAKSLQPNEFEIKSADIVGPSAGGLLRKNGFLAMFYTLIAILLYVSIRFDFKYAPGAVLALVHDATIVLGVFMVLGKEFDLTVLAAILALIGYSNNDTIIVFDRVRETSKLSPGMSIEEVVNSSINQTLGRTIMTSLTTFLSVLMLWLFGGSVLEPFAFALLIGLVVGTYSSVFIASSVMIVLTHYNEKKAKMSKGKKRREVKLSPEANIGI